MKLGKILACSSGMFFLAAVLSATTITYVTPTGSQSATNSDVNATATFTTSAGHLDITLQNLQNTLDASQLLSDLQFTISSGGTATLASSSGQELSVNSDGSISAGSTVSTGWVLGTPNTGGYLLCVICGNGVTASGIQPAHTIIGPGPYTSANGSIQGNDPHNPFLSGVVSFSIDDASIDANTTIDSAIFSFGTTFGDDIPGDPTTPSVPEPLTTALTGVGLLALAAGMRFRRKLSR